MPTERDVYMAANLLVKQHGTEAAIFAAMNSDRLAAKGEHTGARLWLRVIEAIRVLERTAPHRSAGLH